MMLCNILKDFDVMYTILRVTVRNCPQDSLCLICLVGMDCTLFAFSF